MRRDIFGLLFTWIIVALVLNPVVHGQTVQPDNAVLAALTSHQYDLEDGGRNSLIQEARNNDFFLSGNFMLARDAMSRDCV